MADFDEHQDDEEAYCPLCGGYGFELGALGDKRHFRCRDCGADFSDEAKTSATITSWNSVMKTSRQNVESLYIPSQPFDVGGVTYYVDGSITFEYEWGDHGIGPYEFWGDRGVDSQMGADDIRAVEVEAVQKLVPGDSEGEVIDLTPEEEAEVAPDLLDAINNALETDKEFRDLVYAGIEER